MNNLRSYFILLIVIGAFALVLLLTQNKDQNGSVAENTNAVETGGIPTASLYGLEDGKLVLFEQGEKTVLDTGPYTHLFGFSDDGSLLLGNAVETSAIGGLPIPVYEIEIFAYDKRAKEVTNIGFADDAETIYYGDVSHRFVVLHQPQDSSAENNTWNSPVTVLDDAAQIITEFSEPNLSSLAMSEMPDGTILLFQVTQSATEASYVALNTDQTREARTFSIPENTDKEIAFSRATPLAIIQETAEPYYGQLYRLDTSPPKLYADFENIFRVNSIFNQGGTEYMVADTNTYPNEWVPCSRFFRMDGTHPVQVIGNVVFVLPASDNTFIYGEHIDSCQHVRLWETDVNGENAKLIADDYHLDWQNKPVVIP